MIRHLRRPEATDVTVIEIAFDRLAEPRGSTCCVAFPSGREDQRASHRIMRPLLRRRTLLKSNDIAVFCGNIIFDTFRFTVDSFDMFHSVFSFEIPNLLNQTIKKLWISRGDFTIDL